MKPYRLLAFVLVLALTALACGLPAPTPTAAPTATAGPPTPVRAEVGGPVAITGRFTYTNDIITTYYVEQAVALVDMYGFVTRDLEWEIPIESQTLGYLNLDARNRVGEYWLQLPAAPSGKFVDVDNNGQTDQGVQVFAVSYWPNLTGGPFSEGDDPSRGWPSYLASVKTDTENQDEVIGGQLVVWAPDDGQRFPTGFGGDGLLFTADDPVGPIPAGYSIVDLDQQPFAVSREARPELTLYEPQDAAIKDYSALSYSEAFEKLFQKASTEWAFNGVPGKAVDWQEVYDQIAPRVAEAEKAQDAVAFYKALRAFALSIPDGHTGLSGGAIASADFTENIGGGYGFAIRELDDGQVVVVFVTAGGPADKAGMKVGAEVTEFNGQPIAQAIGEVQAVYVGPFSMESSERYQQSRYLLRSRVGTEATVTFANPGGRPQTMTMVSVPEFDSFRVTSIFAGFNPNALPVESRILDSGIGYIKINTNYDDLGLIIRLFERALQVFQANDLSNLIIDMRQNSGGAPLGLAGFLYDQEIPLGQLQYYSEKTGTFEPEGTPRRVEPNQAQYAFDKIAVLVSPACASACEIETYGFSQVPGTIVVGMAPTAGVEAEVARGQFLLPEGLGMQIPTGRFVNPDGSIFLEGTGVVPTMRVPVTRETVLSAEDVVLKAAEDAIFGISPDDLQLDGGPVIGAPASSEAALKANTKALEQAARETYSGDELAQMGKTFTFTLPLDKDQRLLWAYGWCATTQAILDENYRHIRIEFSANNTPIPLDRFYVNETSSGGLFCKSYYAVVYRWPSGPTRLQTRVTFDAPINDGISDYPRGTQTFVYEVTLP